MTENPKKKGIKFKQAQLVFTTHDTWHLSNRLLRHDEIWFVEKNDRGVSTLYSLADFVDEDGSGSIRMLRQYLEMFQSFFVLIFL